MIERIPGEDRMDGFLTRSMAAPVPSLSPDFDQRLLRELRRRSQPMDRDGRLLLSGYGLTSVAASAIVMRGQGLDWVAIAVSTLGPLILLLAATVWVRGARRHLVPLIVV